VSARLSEKLQLSKALTQKVHFGMWVHIPVKFLYQSHQFKVKATKTKTAWNLIPSHAPPGKGYVLEDKVSQTEKGTHNFQGAPVQILVPWLCPAAEKILAQPVILL